MVAEHPPAPCCGRWDSRCLGGGGCVWRRPGAKCYFHLLLFRRCLGQVTYLSLAFLIGTRGPPAWPHWIVLKMNGNVCAVLGWGRWLAEWPLSRGVSRTSLVSPSRRPPGFLFFLYSPPPFSTFFLSFLVFLRVFSLCVSVSTSVPLAGLTGALMAHSERTAAGLSCSL